MDFDGDLLAVLRAVPPDELDRARERLCEAIDHLDRLGLNGIAVHASLSLDRLDELCAFARTLGVAL